LSHHVDTVDIFIQGDHLSGKPGNVGEFGSSQENVQEFSESQGNVRENILPRKMCLRM